MLGGRPVTSLLVLVVAAFFFGMGTVALLRPARVLGLCGVTVATSDGRNEVSAVYGGYGLAMGVLLVFSLATPLLRPGILTCVAVAMLGMAAGRLVSFRIDGRAGFYPRLFLGVEVAISAILLGIVAAG